MKIGVFVGSFDPVHIGHTNVMNYLIDEKIVDKVIVIATGNYWHKQNITNLNDRLNMLEFIKNDNITIDKENNKIKYTYQILEKLKEEQPNDEFYLVIGADNANTLYKWKCYKKIIENGIIVVARDNIKINLKIDNLIIINKNFGYISSTNIRSNLEEYKDFINEKVYNYIIRNKLYESEK